MPVFRSKSEGMVTLNGNSHENQKKMSAFTKKLQASLLAAAVIAQSATSFVTASADGESEARTFIVTAYYSPLPNQDRYLMGSYEADLRLNGNGTHGASGKPVYVGMLAAPKHYEF